VSKIDIENKENQWKLEMKIWDIWSF